MTDDSRTEQLEARVRQLEERLGNGSSSGSGRGAAAASGAREMMAGANEALWALVHRVFPDEARRHMRSATREQLLAARAYLDRWIASLDESGEEPEPAVHERIKVE
jgi:hypothetical protein